MASPPSTKRRRTSSSSSPLPPPLDLAAVDTAIRTPRQPPSRRHRPATHPCYHRCPSRPQHPDGAVLIDLAIGLRSPPPPSASAAASARRETRPQIARRHPAPRIVYDGDKDRKDEEATEGGLEAEKREEGEREGRESRKKGNRTERKRSRGRIRWQCTSSSALTRDGQALATPRCVNGHPTAQGTQRHPQARHEDERIRARQHRGEEHQDGNTHATHNVTLACAEQSPSSASHRRPISARIDARRRIATRRWREQRERGREAGIEKEEEAGWGRGGKGGMRVGVNGKKKRERSPEEKERRRKRNEGTLTRLVCLPPLIPSPAHAPPLKTHHAPLQTVPPPPTAPPRRGMHEARDGGATHVERERAEDERGGDARVRHPGGLARRPARERGGRTLPVGVVTLPSSGSYSCFCGGGSKRVGGVDGEGSGEEADGGGVREAVAPGPPEFVRPRQRRDRGKGGRRLGLVLGRRRRCAAREKSDGILRA
ncbi:hypothetical protein DFH09DRAFT_1428755 [Mycena vulgaris]|nr:hypothetical protein DFH09DRAFT_1428755 [Mycena vulgaris]